MTTMNVSLPNDLKAFVDEQVRQGGYSSSSEYVRDLLRAARKAAEQARLEALLIEGLESGPAVEITDEWWADRRRELEKRIARKAPR